MLYLGVETRACTKVCEWVNNINHKFSLWTKLTQIFFMLYTGLLYFTKSLHQEHDIEGLCNPRFCNIGQGGCKAGSKAICVPIWKLHLYWFTTCLDVCNVFFKCIYFYFYFATVSLSQTLLFFFLLYLYILC